MTRIAWSIVLAAGMVMGASGAAGAESAREILDATGVKGGFVVHLGCGPSTSSGPAGKLTAALCANDSYVVHGLDVNAANVDAARKLVLSLGLGGKVSIDRLTGKDLPYVDNLVNLLVAEDLGGVSMDEVRRVLCPNGVAYIKSGASWTKTVKPRPMTIDAWTHYLHDPSNNAVAHDTVIAPPRHLQWVGSPKWARHHDRMASMSALVSTEDRIFYIFDEGPTSSITLPPDWKLIARDAFNGTILWKRTMGTWHTHLWPLKSGPALLPRRLVAVGDRVYSTLSLDAPLTAFDAATGQTIRTYAPTRGTEEVLLFDGVLYLVVATTDPREGAYGTNDSLTDIQRKARDSSFGQAKRTIRAIQAETGKVLWSKDTDILPMTLTVDASRVLFHDGESVVCLRRDNGGVRWRSGPVARRSFIRSLFAPTLVVWEDIVLFSGGSVKAGTKDNGGGNNTMVALDAATGKQLWSADHPASGYKSPEDLFVIDGLVWCAATSSGGLDGVFRGRDLRTGEVKVEFPPDVKTYWFHHRCHRGKATDRFLLTSRTGIEFIDPKTRHWDINHWIRGGCLYGIMPANGLIYAPPHDCACYLESKQFGFNAVAPASPSRSVPKVVPDEGRLEKGIAYGAIGNRQSTIDNPNEWPTYRGDSMRSGFTKVKVPAQVRQAWQTDVGGKLSSIVAADGKLFVASIDTHTVYALDADSGQKIWSYTVGGRVDSPPTIHAGLALFGSADGWVYALRASDGKLAWRFRAAPIDRRMMAFEQVESLWPVHGSVLVQNGPSTGSGQAAVYCAAGRSMFLDGGLRMLKLDAATGRKLFERVLDEHKPGSDENLQADTMWLNMPVALPDILASDGKRIYMKSQVFDLAGQRGAIGPVSADRFRQAAIQTGEERHLFCPTGYLDGDWFHRSYWMFGRTFCSGWNGYYESGKVTPAGRILVFDDDRVYGFGRKPQYYKWTTPLEYQLFATGKEPVVVQTTGRKPATGTSMVSVAKSRTLDPTDKPLTIEAWVRAGGKDGVIVARGGPNEGFALILKAGKPRFAVRTADSLFSAGAKKAVGTKWTHVAGVMTADRTLQIYVNGQLAGSGKAGALISSPPSQGMEIGADDRGSAGDYPSPFGFTGVLDEVRIYHRALSATEIRKHASTTARPSGKDTGLVAYYSFDAGTAKDDSGNGNDGTTTGTSAVEGTFGKALKFTAPKGKGGVSRYLVQHDWTQEVPILVRAMVLADKTLFIAGPPDVLDEEQAARQLKDPATRAKLQEQTAALAGKSGAVLWAVSTVDGSKLAVCRLHAPPAWDGMIAANGKLYLATVDGKVLCLAGR